MHHLYDIIFVLVGVILGSFGTVVFKRKFKYDGTMDVTETEDKKTYSLNLEIDPDELEGKREIRFKVNRQKESEDE